VYVDNAIGIDLAAGNAHRFVADLDGCLGADHGFLPLHRKIAQIFVPVCAAAMTA
jgi:hypothetical protein